MTTIPQAAPVPWVRFEKGITALEFGAKYAFASDETPRHFGIFWAHQAPDGATWAINLKDLLATIPAAMQAGE